MNIYIISKNIYIYIYIYIYKLMMERNKENAR